MLIIVQFPISDLRRFTSFNEAIIKSPDWKTIGDSDVNYSFVRGVGGIKRRFAGGNALGENYLSTAKNAFRFKSLPEISFISSAFSKKYSTKIRPAFRRFFFDGTACAKYEVGFSVYRERGKTLNHDHLQGFLKSIGNCELTIPIPNHQTVNSRFFESGKYLAKQYIYSTTYSDSQSNELTGVFAEKPCIFFEFSEKEKIRHKYHQRVIQSTDFDVGEMSHFTYEYADIFFKIWTLRNMSAFHRKNARELRIAMLNLNVFRQVLYRVLKQVSSNNLLPEPHSIQSELLNQFFKDSFGKYLNQVPKLINQTDYEWIALQYEDQITGGERMRLEKNLRDVINIRPNYFRSVIKFLKEMDKSRKKGEKKKSGDKSTFKITGNITNSIIGIQSDQHVEGSLINQAGKEEFEAALQNLEEEFNNVKAQLDSAIKSIVEDEISNLRKKDISNEEVKKSGGLIKTLLEKAGTIAGPAISLANKILEMVG